MEGIISKQMKLNNYIIFKNSLKHTLAEMIIFSK